MLLRLGRIGKYDITRIEQIFARLDKDKTGVLDKRDVQDLLALQKIRHAKHVGENGEEEEPEEEDADADADADAAGEAAGEEEEPLAEVEEVVAEESAVADEGDGGGDGGGDGDASLSEQAPPDSPSQEEDT